ncbi:hypothetical protein [Enterococcus sp. AZ109]|uniref:hypothetical protein n=1 Tax=Enterococcus sp. AZ109 TaxID=2774634 RepID=UPI003F202357
METKDFLNYLELALKNLHATEAMHFNIRGEVSRLLKLYSVEEVNEKLNKK